VKIDVVDSVDSTSSELNRRASREDVHRRLLIAEWQTAGRGRRGRGGTAIAGGSLTFSLGWRFEQGAGFLAGLSLAGCAGLGMPFSATAARASSTRPRSRARSFFLPDSGLRQH
jgi:biotin-(acetyl-CoA carboxylase) ligase